MAGWDENHSLEDFGVERAENPPRMRYDHKIRVPGTTNLAGHVGPMPTRDVLGFVKLCDEGDRMWDPRAHALDDTVLSKIQSYGTQRVIALEIDTKVVWEWPIREFKDDQSVPKRIRGENPPQTFAYLQDATKWEDHGDDVRIQDNVDLTRGHKTSHDWNRGETDG